jgi:hypothetical protein
VATKSLEIENDLLVRGRMEYLRVAAAPMGVIHASAPLLTHYSVRP